MLLQSRCNNFTRECGEFLPPGCYTPFIEFDENMDGVVPTMDADSPVSRSRGLRGVTGGSLPAEIWQKFMRAATEGDDATAFEEPVTFPGQVLNEQLDPTTTTEATSSTSSTTTSSSTSTTVEETTTSSTTTSSTTTTTEATTTTTEAAN